MRNRIGQGRTGSSACSSTRRGADNAWRNVIAQLDNVNLSINNLSKVSIYLADRSYALENRAIRRAILDDRGVAMTIVIAGIFDESLLLEIEATGAE